MTPNDTKTRLEVIDGVHVLTLADPAKRNAVGFEMAAELVRGVDGLAADPEVRALVVAGEGPAFCAGADFPDVFGEVRPTAEMRAALRRYYECFLRIRALPFPTFAAVDGAAIGAGLNLALSCDVRVASPRAKFGATFTRIGLHPGGGCSYFLVQALGRERALRLLLEGGILDGEAAFAAALISALDDDPFTAALELAKQAAALEPWLARAVVEAVELASTATFDAVLEFESWAQAESTRSDATRAHVRRLSAR
jgi:enoyl-CoA hydratase